MNDSDMSLPEALQAYVSEVVETPLPDRFLTRLDARVASARPSRLGASLGLYLAAAVAIIAGMVGLLLAVRGLATLRFAAGALYTTDDGVGLGSDLGGVALFLSAMVCAWIHRQRVLSDPTTERSTDVEMARAEILALVCTAVAITIIMIPVAVIGFTGHSLGTLQGCGHAAAECASGRVVAGAPIGSAAILVALALVVWASYLASCVRVVRSTIGHAR